MAKDWNFFSGKNICALRVGAILAKPGAVLLDYILDSDEYCLPGGRVQIGETTEAALRREMREKLDLDITTQRLVFVSENFWPWQDYLTHFVEFDYLISAENVKTSFDGDDANVKKVWVPLERLSQLTTRPAKLTDQLTALPSEISHVVNGANTAHRS